MSDSHVAAKPSGLLYALNGVAPTIHPTAWIAPTAVLIGDVRVGPGAIHVDHGEYLTDIGEDVTIGHSAIIHACKLRNRAFIGMGATVLDGAIVEEAGLLGARGLLGPGKRIGAQELWIGSPARLSRTMTDAERAGWDETVPHYLGLAEMFRGGLTEVG
jgi:carbonic anhydrase/acetyltransferase-like protein (isoleucine patch superfamily)